MRSLLSSQRRSPTEPGGFTLIELLVAICLISIVAAGLGSVLHSGLKLWKRVERDARLDQEAGAVLDLIGREFEGAMDVPGVSWSVKEGAVTFATLRDAGDESQSTAKAPRIAEVTYQTEGPAMTLSRIERNLSPDPLASGEKPAALTSCPTRVQWEYAYASETAGGPVRWEMSWNVPDSLPAGIRVHLTLSDPDGDAQTFERTFFSPARDLMPDPGNP